MLAAFAYPWIAIYAAHFFPRRAVNAQAVLISAGFGAGLLLSGLPHVAIYWVVVTVTIWSICILLGNLSESLRLQAGTDHLTGLLNRSGFLAAALRERALADRTGAPLSVALIDLDQFKEINDRDGHAVGDRLLADLARRGVSGCARATSSRATAATSSCCCCPAPGRPAQTRRSGACAASEDTVGWSVGISEWSPGEELDAPLARADKQLYEAKLALRPARSQNGSTILWRGTAGGCR